MLNISKDKTCPFGTLDWCYRSLKGVMLFMVGLESWLGLFSSLLLANLITSQLARTVWVLGGGKRH